MSGRRAGRCILGFTLCAVLRAIPAAGQTARVPALVSTSENWNTSRSTSTKQQPAAMSVSDLPLVEMPVSVPGRRPGSRWLAVLLTGDGGWARIDRTLAAGLNHHGIAVVGFNSLRYFWSPRTPAGTAVDLTRVLRYYTAAWRADRVVLVGYSRGADVLPIVATRLPSDLRRHIELVALLAPERYATFRFRLRDWISPAPAWGLPTGPAIVGLGWTHVLCVYGDRERESACPDLPAGAADRLQTHGGHHLGGDYAALADTIAARLP